jgi:hypothetical protein
MTRFIKTIKEHPMKIILRIFVILLVAAAVAGASTLVVNNTSLASAPGGAGGQPPAMTNAGGQFAQPPAHAEGGGEHGVSVERGLTQVVITLGKLAGITIIVLLVQKGLDLLRKLAPKLAQG